MASPSPNQQRRSQPTATTQTRHDQHLAPPLPPPQTTDPLHCPRCDSPNTKFCYYNNYNLSQPRHFCKSCRRYWTHGGTLRDVPVGGGSRKSAKRSRSSSSAAATSSSSSSSSTLVKVEPGSAQVLDNPNPNANECVTSNNSNNGSGSGSGSGFGFTSLLNSQSPGLLALGGYGYGFGLEEISGLGFGAKSVWPFHEVGDFGGGTSSTSAGGGANTWQIGSGSEGGLVDGSSVDCFVWPDLSISMPGVNSLK